MGQHHGLSGRFFECGRLVGRRRQHSAEHRRGPEISAIFAKQRRPHADPLLREQRTPEDDDPGEAKLLSEEGFGILPVFQDSSRDISNF